MTHQADEIRRMADALETVTACADESGVIRMEISPHTLDKAAAMLREYAEGVERIDAMAIRASNKLGQMRKRVISKFDAMHAELIAALSGREAP